MLLPRRIVLGHDTAGMPVFLPEKPCHIYICGASGFGKSKLMELIERAMLLRGDGISCPGIHGAEYEDILNFCAQRCLDRRINLLNLSEPGMVVPIYPFALPEGGEVSVKVDGTGAAFLRGWGTRNTDQMPTLDRTLRQVLTLAVENQLGLAQIRFALDHSQRRLREYLTKRLTSELVAQEWRELNELDRTDWQNEILSLKNRLFRVLTSPTLCRPMSLPDHSLDMKTVMDKRQSVLSKLALSNYLSSENARVFNAVFVHLCFEAAKRRRPGRAGDSPVPHYLFLDEFQNYVTLDIADILDQTRKFGLFLVLAHQRFAQVDENVLEAALTNCQMKVVFGGLTADAARRMAEELLLDEVDPYRVKLRLSQTKFWPRYTREKTYTESSSRTTSSTSGGSVSWGTSQTDNGAGVLTSTSEGGSGVDSESRSQGRSSSEADVPFLRPEPFREVSSVQYLSVEEQLVGLTAELKNLSPRHCIVKLPGQPAQRMRVAFVEPARVSRESRKWYERQMYGRAGAITAKEADRLIAIRERRLLAKVRESRRVISASIAKPKARGQRKAKGPTLFDQLMGGEKE